LESSLEKENQTDMPKTKKHERSIKRDFQKKELLMYAAKRERERERDHKELLLSLGSAMRA
jgi:hypothetical protein